jgi:shikimate dehydrogenase
VTQKYAVFGNPIAQSKSPIIHKMFAQQSQQDIEYSRKIASKENFEQSLRDFFTDPDAMGCNITAPFKEQAAAWVNELSAAAKMVGAVNTIIKQADGSFLGDTTDGIGLVQDLLRVGVKIKGTRILLLGAGGAARGVLQPLLALEPEMLIIANRTESKAQALASLFVQDNIVGCSLSQVSKLNGSVELIINATSSSLSAELPSIEDSILQACTDVYDMSYADQPTVFMQHANQLGIEQTYDGLGMLVGQAAQSFYLWRGVRPIVEPVIEALRAGL